MPHLGVQKQCDETKKCNRTILIDIGFLVGNFEFANEVQSTP